MSKLSWNEIRQRAIEFSRGWEGASRESAEAQTFWNEFFQVFGVNRRLVNAVFEEKVRSVSGSYHRIDLFWKGRLLAEHKSAGESLDKASSQAFNYIQELAASNRDDEIPRYVVVSDFARIVLFDLEPDDPDEATLEIALLDLHKQIKHFAFLIGQKTHRFGEEDPANLKAAQIMADLHGAVEDSGYPQRDLERLLVRLLFCLFADDTGIFKTAQFDLYLDNHTRSDGSDLGQQFLGLFEILNTPEDQRQENIEEDLADFPYVNGELFADRLPLAHFNPDMRNCLRAACRFDWSRISPAIFGSLFQGIMDPKERRQIGGHYTSERNILKVIRPLFLDSLYAVFEQIKKDRSGRRKNRLVNFQVKLAKLKLLDPACGCGNFLVIAYRELRRLELDILKELNPTKGITEFSLGEITKMSHVNVDQFYGIEIGEWPARIAETALWLTDHQMNTELSLTFGNVFQRIPLRAAPHIRCENALRFDWNKLLPANECAYVLGNPPFVGHQWRTNEQQTDMHLVWGRAGRFNRLDYVAAWYRRAAEYLQTSARRDTRCAFVSTNSITQGEQVATLWGDLFQRGIKIDFAHRTFAWESESRGKAHVHVVIIGFGVENSTRPKFIYEYHEGSTTPTATIAANINPYLVDALDLLLPSRAKPGDGYPQMKKGSQPTDGGFLLLSRDEKVSLLENYPELEKWLRPFVGGEEFINGNYRWCFWVKNASPAELRASPEIQRRLEGVRESRLKSPTKSVREFAAFPNLFTQDRQPDEPYLAVPEVSSENRVYIPMGFLSENIIASNKLQVIVNAELWHFGILTSAIHMAWVRVVSGRLESRISYAPAVYNNFPWPVEATEVQKAKVEVCAQTVLDARQKFLDGGSTLADLYDPLYMPGDLLKAHKALDRAVDRCYRSKKFESERERVEFLFQLYEEITAPLAPTPAPKKKRRRRATTPSKK